MDGPLKICHVVAPGVVGGLERVVQGLARGHHEQGHEVHVISVIGPEEGEHPFATPLVQAGVRVHEVRLPGRAVLQERRRVRELLRSIRPHVVHAHGYRPDLLHATTARSLGIATATTEHGSSKLGGRTAFFEWLQLRFFRRAQAVVAVSSPIAERLVREDGVPPRLVHLIPNGWAGGSELLPRAEARRRLGIEPDRVVAAFVGRLIPAKGPDVFVDAVLRGLPEGTMALVIGDGSERAELEERVRVAGMAEQVRFAGHVDDAAPLFSAFDLFVLSSRTEGTPIVLFEAMSAGVPAVVTRVGGVPDVVGDDGAYVVDPENPEALHAALREVLAGPELMEARAARATERLQDEFSASRWLARHEALYRDIAASH